MRLTVASLSLIRAAVIWIVDMKSARLSSLSLYTNETRFCLIACPFWDLHTDLFIIATGWSAVWLQRNCYFWLKTTRVFKSSSRYCTFDEFCWHSVTYAKRFIGNNFQLIFMSLAFHYKLRVDDNPLDNPKCLFKHSGRTCVLFATTPICDGIYWTSFGYLDRGRRLELSRWLGVGSMLLSGKLDSSKAPLLVI